jgi:hypothetical protein
LFDEPSTLCRSNDAYVDNRLPALIQKKMMWLSIQRFCPSSRKDFEYIHTLGKLRYCIYVQSYSTYCTVM